MTIQNHPKISVIMPNLNGEKYLEQSISSILGQDFLDFEFIIIDDGSTDNSKNIIKNFQKKDKRIRFYENNENIGIAKTLNIGISKALGKYIARMDSDDISLPNRFSLQYNFLEKNQEITALGGNIEMFSTKNNKKIFKKFPENIKAKHIWQMSPLAHPSVMIRKDIIQKVGGYNEDFESAEDLELWIRLISKGYTLCNLNKKILKYRISETNSTLANPKKVIHFTLKARREAKRLGIPMPFIAKISYFSVWLLQFFPKKFIFYTAHIFQIFYVKIQTFHTYNNKR